MNNRFPAIAIMALIVLGIANSMSSLVLWIVTGIAVIALAGMIAYLVVSGRFTPPTTLIDDVRVKARDVKAKVMTPIRSDHDVVD